MLTLFFLIKNIQLQWFCFLRNCRSRLEVRTLPMKAIAEPNHRFSSKNYSKGSSVPNLFLSTGDRVFMVALSQVIVEMLKFVYV